MRSRWLMVLFLTAAPFASVLLDIPPRQQWYVTGQYCGECTLQQIALHYGGYVSQKASRAIAGEVLLDVNMPRVLDSLSLTHQEWDIQQQPPQYQPFLVWVVGHLAAGHPVAFGVFLRGYTDTGYDHIEAAIGFTATSPGSYNDTNRLFFNNCIDSTTQVRTFGSLWDTRAMTGNGAAYTSCIPRDRDFGCAITGIRDDLGVTVPVSLVIDNWKETDVTQGIAPTQVNARVRVTGLSAGARYVLLRYDAPAKVPSRQFTTGGASSNRSFVAAADTASFADQFPSDGLVTYRCVPASQVAVVVAPRADPASHADRTHDAAPLFFVNGRMYGAAMPSARSIGEGGAIGPRRVMTARIGLSSRSIRRQPASVASAGCPAGR